MAPRGVERRLVGPQAQPVAVGERGGLLEGTEQDDGGDDGRAHGPEVLPVHLQLNLTTEEDTTSRVFYCGLITSINY